MRHLIFLASACLVILTACREQPAATSAAPQPVILAQSGKEVITESEFLAEMKARGVSDDSRQREALLAEMTERLRLLAYAREQGFENDPEVKRSHEALLIAKAREALGSSAEQSLALPSEEEQQAAYNLRRREFTAPTTVRVAMIFSRDRSKIDQVMKLSGTLPSAEKGFGTLAVQWSEDQATRYTGGDFGDLISGHTEGVLPPEAVAAAFGLEKPGDLSPVIQSNDGLRIFRLISKTPEVTQSYAQARPRLLTELSQQRHRERELAAAKRIASLPGESFPERLPR